MTAIADDTNKPAFSDDDFRKAKVFFDRAATVAGTGNYDYGIELYIQGLGIHPEDVDAHQALRDISLKRKGSGGKSMGMKVRFGLPKAKDDKQAMLNAEKQLAYDPGDMDHMVNVLTAAYKANYVKTVLWIGPILQRANAEQPDQKKMDAKKFLILKDVYKGVGMFQLAIDSLHSAAMLRPDDMDLQRELKDLSARETMKVGNYEKGDFRESMRDVEGQQKRLDEDKDIRTLDAMSRLIAEAEAQFKTDPTEASKISKYVELLQKSDDPENENKAIEVLESAYNRTKSFRFRQTIGEIKMKQVKRIGRSLIQAYKASPNDKHLRADVISFETDRLTLEYNEFKLAAEAYPTDLRFRFEMARRLFELHRYSEAIPVFQQARSDPKFRNEATLLLGRAFLEAEFADEAVDTLKAVIDAYEPKGDARHTEMTYWYGRSLEAKGDKQAAIKAYSQVTMADFNYKDVQTRIKALRAADAKPDAGSAG